MPILAELPDAETSIETAPVVDIEAVAAKALEAPYILYMVIETKIVRLAKTSDLLRLQNMVFVYDLMILMLMCFVL